MTNVPGAIRTKPKAGRGGGVALCRGRIDASDEALTQQGRVVARFTPGRDGQIIPFDLEDLYSPYWGLDRYERPGPTITVYELPGR